MKLRFGKPKLLFYDYSWYFFFSSQWPRGTVAEHAHFMLWPDQFQKICQIKAWYYRIDLTHPLRSLNSLDGTIFWKRLKNSLHTCALNRDNGDYKRKDYTMISQKPSTVFKLHRGPRPKKKKKPSKQPNERKEWVVWEIILEFLVSQSTRKPK